jgi:hypothetical protein
MNEPSPSALCQCVAVWATVLFAGVYFVVAITHDASLFKRPIQEAESGVMVLIENVRVANVAIMPRVDSLLVRRLQISQLVGAMVARRCHRILGQKDTDTGIHLLLACRGAASRFSREIKVGREWVSESNELPARKHSYVLGRGLAEIVNGDRHFLSIDFDRDCGADCNVGPQTTLFLIRSGSPLFTGVISGGSSRDQCEKQHDRNRPFQRMFLLAISAALIGTGIYCAMFTARRRGIQWFSFGCLVAMFGWFAIVFQDDLLAISERVSTAIGIDASATCYSTSENVRVLPIKGDHNAQMAFCAETSPAQKAC